MRLRTLLAALLLVGASAGGALAVEPEEQLQDPALEHRARELSQELRCVVCQNQSIDDSDAQIAADIRKLVRKRITEEKTDQEIKDELVEYYGEYVLLRPRFSLQNMAIWLIGPVALIIGLIWVRRRIGTPATADGAGDAGAEPVAPPLSDEEKKRLERLMKE